MPFLPTIGCDDRFPECKTVTKVGCSDMQKLMEWGKKYHLKPEWIDMRKDGYSHFDLLGDKQREILEKEGLLHQLLR